MTADHDRPGSDPTDVDLDDPRLELAGGPKRLRDDPLLHLLGVNWLIGAAVGVALVAAVLITDTAHLRSLILASDQPWIGCLLLFFGFTVTMCSVAMGTAIMTLPKDDDDDEPKGGMKLEVLKLPSLAPEPVPVRVPAKRQPHRRG